MGKKLTEKELKKFNTIQKDFYEAKMELAEMELRKAHVMDVIRGIKVEMRNLDAELSEKYGTDIMINSQTGEISKKK